MVVTVLQFLGAIYLMFIVLTDISYGGRSTSWFLGNFLISILYLDKLNLYMLCLLLSSKYMLQDWNFESRN